MLRRFNVRFLIFVLGFSFVIQGCQTTIPKEALQLSSESLKTRQLQTRRFDTKEEATLLSASAQVLQDLGFNLDESETKLGVIVASKDRDATEAGQIVGAVLIAVIFGVSVPVDKLQKIRVSLVTRPMKSETGGMAVRITFQRLIWNDRGQISRLETLDDAKIYQEFFEKLSKAVFLEAHEI